MLWQAPIKRISLLDDKNVMDHTQMENRESSAGDQAVTAPVHLYKREYFESGNYADRPLGRFSMYWFARRYYAALLRRFAPPVADGALLEAGCGMGHLLGLLQDDFRCSGIDLMDYAIERTRVNAPKARVLQGDVNQPGIFEDGEFSVVVALHLTEHLERPREFIGEMHRVLQPGGLFLFATPHPEYKLRRVKDRATDAIGKDPTHINCQPPAVWRAWCLDTGFGIERHFSDGLWDVPYLPLLPKPLQFALFGLPALWQVLTRTTLNPLDWGVNQVVIARKPAKY